MLNINHDFGQRIDGEIDVIKQGNGLFTVKTCAYNDDGTPFVRLKRFHPIRNLNYNEAMAVIHLCQQAGYDAKVFPAEARSL